MTELTTRGATGSPASAHAAGPDKIKKASPDEAAALFADARRVVIVPGYGMALSHAHHTIRDLTHVLEARRIQVTFGVHPLAGRMPGQMNVLLGEADIPDDSVKQLEEINPTFAHTDVVVVVGASDVVNPLAPTAPDCPLAGMAVLEVGKARHVLVIKRSAAAGFSGVPNPLLAAPNTSILAGDATKAMLELIASLLRTRPKRAEPRVGTVTHWQALSPLLAIFRLMPQEGTRFPEYKAGQYIALRRDNCRLTKRVVGHDGNVHFIPDLDEQGVQKRGPVMHSYSISSAPFETRRDGYLELYVVREEDEWGYGGRLTHSLFQIRVLVDDKIAYVDRIVGDFTLDKRARGFRNVVMVGTGTGVAPFAAMIKELDHQALEGKRDEVRYTLLHANRTPEELAYHEQFVAIEAAGRFDFTYVPAISRPRDGQPQGLGAGRANNILRLLFEMPLKEEEDLRSATAKGEAAARAALDRAVRPGLPEHLRRGQLVERMTPGETVVLSCGNPASMRDVKTIAESNGIRFEKEDWKHEPSGGA
jgi:ferredoxin-NADP reductase